MQNDQNIIELGIINVRQVRNSEGTNRPEELSAIRNALLVISIKEKSCKI